MICPPRPRYLALYQWSELLSEIDGHQMLYLFAHDPKRLAPVGILRLDLSEPAGYISSLWVDPEHRNRSLGAALISQAAAACTERGLQTLGLQVKTVNTDARRLYTRLGFRQYLDGHEGYTQLVKFL